MMNSPELLPQRAALCGAASALSKPDKPQQWPKDKAQDKPRENAQDLSKTVKAQLGRATNDRKAVILMGLKSPFWGLICFLAGTISGLVIQQRFVALLPGPKVHSFIRSERLTEPGKPVCNFYLFSFIPSDSIDYMYVKLQFPNPITSFIVGVPQETVMASADREHNFGWEKGWDSNGECAVSNATIDKNPDVQFSATGNMIGIHASKLPVATRIIGLIATTGRHSAVEPIPSTIWTEGEYEYLKLGQTVRKKVPITITLLSSAN